MNRDSRAEALMPVLRSLGNIGTCPGWMVDAQTLHSVNHLESG
jgi:hypothetical protein